MGEVILQMKNITKRYPGVVALNNVSVDFKEGEVHALLGENGAGKSTLIKVLSGAVINDSGEIIIDGKSYAHMTPQLSRSLGVEVIYQEYNLIPGLTVAENIYIGKQMHGLVDMKTMIRDAQAIFDKYGIDVDPKALVRDLSPAKQQLVEITKAVAKDARILVMDEPTAQLTLAEVEKLYEIIAALKAQNVAIIYISHRLDELFAVTDCVTIMRDGCYVDTVLTKETNRDHLIALMVGRELSNLYRTESSATDEVVLEVKNFSGLRNDDCSFELHRGEILGVAGLVGAGRTELMRLVYGADKKTSGTIVLNGKEVHIHSPKDALAHGIGLIPEDRKVQGCFLNNTIEWNIAISDIKRMTTGGLVDNKKISKRAADYKEKLNIKTPSIKQMVRNLSGGNQQKVVLAKVLATDSDIIIFDEPTRGIDVGARHEIYTLMSDLVKQGKSIIMISSDMEELIGMSDRVIVMSEGKITGGLDRKDFTQEAILALASNN
jgi:ribose transport system ATP-binding protein